MTASNMLPHTLRAISGFRRGVKWYLRSSPILRRVQWQFVADVSGQPIGAFFKGQAVQEIFDCLTTEDGTDRLSQNVDKELPFYAA
jgi:hypothetical protein